MTNQKLGILIGAIFGLAFIWINSDELSSETARALQGFGVVAFLGLIAVLTQRSPDERTADAPKGIGFGPGYWLVVLIVLFGGLFIINGVLDASGAGVAWVALVVGVHFIALAIVWRAPVFHLVGGVIAVCGALGLALAVVDASEATIAVVSGIIPGAVLIGSGWWAALGDQQTHRGSIPS
jgi:hypothetical protein